MNDALEITASSLTILACGVELARLTKRTVAGGDTSKDGQTPSATERYLQLVLGIGAVCLALGTFAFLFARGEVEPAAGDFGESFPDSSDFPETSITFALCGVAAGVIALWLGAAVRKTNEGLSFSLVLIGAGILIVFFASSLPDAAFSS